MPALVGMFGVCQPRLAPTKTGCAALNDRGGRTNGPHLPVSASGRCQPWLACSGCANQGWHLPKQDVPPSTIKVCGPTVHTCPAPRLVDANLGWHVRGVPAKVGTYQNRMCRPQRSRCADQRSAPTRLRVWWMPTWVGMFGVCQPRLAPTKTGCAALNDRGGRTSGPQLPRSAAGGCQPGLACSGCANQGWHLPMRDTPPSTIVEGLQLHCFAQGSQVHRAAHRNVPGLARQQVQQVVFDLHIQRAEIDPRRAHVSRAFQA